jgi:AbrB family looped-hinge helix DNA binding protein
MKSNLVVSSRGQLTLPAEIRKKYGIDEGTIMTAEDRNGEIVLKPASVMEVDFYSDDQVKSWVKADSFASDADRASRRAKLKTLTKAK